MAPDERVVSGRISNWGGVRPLKKGAKVISSPAETLGGTEVRTWAMTMVIRSKHDIEAATGGWCVADFALLLKD